MKSSFINPKIEFIYKKRFVKSNLYRKTFCEYKNNEQFIKKSFKSIQHNQITILNLLHNKSQSYPITLTKIYQKTSKIIEST